MNTSETVRVVHSALGLLAVWALFYISYRSYLLDHLRQTLFEIRDDLFDLAAIGEVQFDAYCYRSLREDLNSLILFADKMSFIRIALAPMPENPTERHERWYRSMDAAPPLVRRALLEMHQHAMYEVMMYITQRSITLLIFSSATRLAGLWIDASRQLFNKFYAFSNRVEAQALDEYRSAA